MAKGHYVPQVYLRRFIDNSFKIKETTWQIIKSQNDLIKSVPIANICCKSNLYVSHIFDNKKDNEFVEKEIYSSKIEPDYNIAYDLLTDSEKIELTYDEKKLILISILSMYYRHYDHLKNKNLDVEKDLENISDFLRNNDKSSKYKEGKSTIDFAQKESTLNNFKKANKEQFILDHLKRSLELIINRMNDTIIVIKLKSEYSFITSEKPFYFNNYLGFFKLLHSCG